VGDGTITERRNTMGKRKTPSKETYPKTDFAYVDTVQGVNHKPHPYMIGPRHVGYAADHCSGMLGESAILGAEARGISCAHRHCNLRYDEHTSDFVAFVKFTGDCTQDQMSDWLKSTVPWAEEYGIDGFAFVESEFEIK
jgi:hypothetical protein